VSSTRSKLRRTAKPLRALAAAVTGVIEPGASLQTSDAVNSEAEKGKGFFWWQSSTRKFLSSGATGPLSSAKGSGKKSLPL